MLSLMNCFVCETTIPSWYTGYVRLIIYYSKEIARVDFLFHKECFDLEYVKQKEKRPDTLCCLCQKLLKLYPHYQESKQEGVFADINTDGKYCRVCKDCWYRDIAINVQG